MKLRNFPLINFPAILLPSDSNFVFIYVCTCLQHILYRTYVGKLQPPIIPFMPLLLKDMTFAHEGNKTSVDGLVNFEKMHMMASTMRAMRFCRSRHLGEICIYQFYEFTVVICQILFFLSFNFYSAWTAITEE